MLQPFDSVSKRIPKAFVPGKPCLLLLDWCCAVACGVFGDTGCNWVPGSNQLSCEPLSCNSCICRFFFSARNLRFLLGLLSFVILKHVLALWPSFEQIKHFSSRSPAVWALVL